MNRISSFANSPIDYQLTVHLNNIPDKILVRALKYGGLEANEDMVMEEINAVQVLNYYGVDSVKHWLSVFKPHLRIKAS